MRQRSIVILAIVGALVLCACSKTPEERRAGYLKSAGEYAAQGKYAEAAIQYQNALKIAPDDVETLIDLGNTELRLHRVKEAYRSFLKASKIDPRNIRALTNLAAIYLLAKDYENALKSSLAILDIDRDNPRAREIQAQALYLTGKKSEALSIMEQILARGKPSESAIINSVQMYLGAGQTDKALSLIQKGIQQYRASSRLRFQASEIYAARKNLGEARMWAEEAYSMSPKGISDGLTLAGFYLRHGFSAPLDALIKELTERFPQDPRPLMLQAEASRARGDLKSALDLALKAQTIQDTPATKQAVAELLIAQGEKQKAKDILEKAIEQDHNAASARLILAGLILAEGDAAKTFSIIDPLLREAPTNPDVAIIAAKAYLLKADTEKARQIIETSIKAHPQNPGLHAALSQIHFSKGAYKDTIIEADKALQATPTALNVLSMAAIASVRIEQFDKALAYIEPMRRAYPDAWPTIYCETLYYAAKGEKDKTLQSANRALKLWPDKPESLSLYANIAPQIIGLPDTIDEIGRLCAKGKSSQCRLTLAGLLEAAGRKEEALDAIKLAIDQDPKRIDLYHSLASFYIRNHMTAQALREYEDILNRKPDDLKAATLLALVHHDAGHIEDAVKVYSYILERDPGNAIASNNLAWIMANEPKRPNLDRALQLATKAKEKFPDNPRIADTLGFVYLKKGLYANAQAQFSSALERTPKDPMVNYHMALVLSHQGRYKDAIPFVQKALSSEERFSERDAAQRLLSDLSARKS